MDLAELIYLALTPGSILNPNAYSIRKASSVAALCGASVRSVISTVVRDLPETVEPFLSDGGEVLYLRRRSLSEEEIQLVKAAQKEREERKKKRDLERKKSLRSLLDRKGKSKSGKELESEQASAPSPSKIIV